VATQFGLPRRRSGTNGGFLRGLRRTLAGILDLERAQLLVLLEVMSFIDLLVGSRRQMRDSRQSMMITIPQS
jgi:hypothetical protein